MKLLLKEVVYFEVQTPDGSDRAEVTNVFRKDIEPLFKDLIHSIEIDKPELDSLKKAFGSPVSIRILTEREALSTTSSQQRDQ